METLKEIATGFIVLALVIGAFTLVCYKFGALNVSMAMVGVAMGCWAIAACWITGMLIRGK